MSRFKAMAGGGELAADAFHEPVMRVTQFDFHKVGANAWNRDVDIRERILTGQRDFLPDANVFGCDLVMGNMSEAADVADEFLHHQTEFEQIITCHWEYVWVEFLEIEESRAVNYAGVLAEFPGVAHEEPVPGGESLRDSRDFLNHILGFPASFCGPDWKMFKMKEALVRIMWG